MLVFWSTRNNVKRIPEGKREKHKCSQCGKTATFYECEVDKGVRLYFVIPVFGLLEKVMQCGECLAVFKDDTPDKASQLQAQRLAKEEAAKEAEQKRIKDEEYKQREAEVDDELAQLKKDLGK